MPSALHPNITIAACEEEHIASAKRLNALLLPVRYADKFYSEILTDDVVASLTLVALWNDTPRRSAALGSDGVETSSSGGGDAASGNGTGAMGAGEGTKEETAAPTTPLGAAAAAAAATTTTKTSGPGRVVGFVRCRLDMSSAALPSSSSDGTTGTTPRLYISTICVLPAFARIGVGSALLREVIKTAVADYGAGTVYAHVWEANQEAIDWYTQRGFAAEGELVRGYYRKLRPDGAWVITRKLGVRDGLGGLEDGWRTAKSAKPVQ